MPLYFFLSAPKWLLLIKSQVVLDIYWLYELSFFLLIAYISSYHIHWCNKISLNIPEDFFFLGLLVGFLAIATSLGVDSLERLALVFAYVYFFLRMRNHKTSLIIFLLLVLALILLFDFQDSRESPLYGEGLSKVMVSFFQNGTFWIIAILLVFRIQAIYVWAGLILFIGYLLFGAPPLELMHVNFVDNHQSNELRGSTLDLILIKFIIRRDWVWWTDSAYTAEQFATLFYYTFDLFEFFKKFFSSVNYSVGHVFGFFLYENRELAGEYSVSLRGGGSFNFDLVTWAYLMSGGGFIGWIFFSMFLGFFGFIFTVLNKYSKSRSALFLSTNLLFIVTLLTSTYVDRDIESLVIFLATSYILLQANNFHGFRK